MSTNRHTYAYVEFATEVSTKRDADWQGTFNTGFIYELTESIQLNTGVEIVVTRSADDWDVFAGMAWRF